MADPNEKAVAIIEKKMAPIAAKAIEIVIKTPEQQKEAGEMLTQLNKYGDELDALKKTITDPMNKALKAARALFKPREDKVEEAVNALRKAMGAYQLKAEQKAEKERDKIAQKVEDGKMSAEKGVAKMADVAAPEANIETNGGSVKFRDQKKFEVMDITLLPIEYHLADESAIRKAMQANIELPGVRYWVERTVVNTR